MNFDAVIFDMDGVLTDSEPAFFEAVNLVLADEGASIDWERYQQFLGTSVVVTWKGIATLLELPGRVRTYLERYGDVLIECLRRPRPPLPGAVELLDALAERDVPYALATSSWGPWADAVLDSAGLDGRFERVVTGDQVKHEKPAPDIYLRAAELLSTMPNRCVAVEDTLPGIASARAAGIYAVQVRASSTAFPPIDEADLVIDTLHDFPLSLLSQPPMYHASQ